MNDGLSCRFFCCSSFMIGNMHELLQKERVQWLVMLGFLIALVVVIITFFEWMVVPYMLFWRSILYSTLIILCIPLFVETLLHQKLKSEHDKIISDLKRIEQELQDYSPRAAVTFEALFAPAIPVVAAKKINPVNAKPRKVKKGRPKQKKADQKKANLKKASLAKMKKSKPIKVKPRKAKLKRAKAKNPNRAKKKKARRRRK